MINATFLTESPLFRDLDESERAQLLVIGQLQTFKSETVIFHEGDEGNGLYVLTRGAVRISKHSAGGEEALTILEPFAFFGEMALIDAAPRAADAIAHGDTELFFLPLSDLRFLFEARPSLALKILFALSATLAQRLRETNERYMSLFTLAQWGTSQNGLIPLS